MKINSIFRWLFPFLRKTLGFWFILSFTKGLVASRRDIVELLANDPRVVAWKQIWLWMNDLFS